MSLWGECGEHREVSFSLCHTQVSPRWPNPDLAHLKRGVKGG